MTSIITSSVSFLISGVLSFKQSINGLMSYSNSDFYMASLFMMRNFNKAVLISGLSGVISLPVKLIIDSAPTAVFQASITSKVLFLTNLSLSTKT